MHNVKHIYTHTNTQNTDTIMYMFYMFKSALHCFKVNNVKMILHCKTDLKFVQENTITVFSTPKCHV